MRAADGFAGTLSKEHSKSEINVINASTMCLCIALTCVSIHLVCDTGHIAQK